MEQRRALGKGLASLIPKAKVEKPPPGMIGKIPSEKEEMPFREVLVSQIRPSSTQPRKNFDEEQIDELAQSIRQKGILQPLLVRTIPEGFELIAGERRLRAAKKTDLEKVPVIVRDVARQEQLELALVENLQRADLDPIEEAEGFAELMGKFSCTQEDVAVRVGRSRSSVANSLRLLKLPDKAQQALRSGEITVGHAKVLLGESVDIQLLLLDKLIKDDLAVRQLERLAKALGSRREKLKPREESSKNREISSTMERIEEELKKRLGTQVRLESAEKGGRIIVEYYSDEQLDDLYQRMTGYHLTRRKTRGL